VRYNAVSMRDTGLKNRIVNRTAKSKQGGFTLIEIMVVVVIIGMLATMILPKVLGRQDEAFIAKAKSDIRAMSSSIKLFKLDNFKYPGALSELVSGGSKGRGYLDKVPKDPWGNEYQYAYPGTHLEFDIWSAAAGSLCSSTLQAII